MRLDAEAGHRASRRIAAPCLHAGFRARVSLSWRARSETGGAPPCDAAHEGFRRQRRDRARSKLDLFARNARWMERDRAHASAVVYARHRPALSVVGRRPRSLRADHAGAIRSPSRAAIMMIRVVKPGALSMLQDLGRFGYQRYGVIVDGAMDEWAHRVANMLVGNVETDATLEITLVGPALAFSRTTVIALCGADLSPRIGEREFPTDRPVRLAPGSVLR